MVRALCRPAVETKLKAAGIDTAARFAGTDRADTSAQAAEFAVKNLNFTDTHVGVASGYVDGYGADALAGGPLEGKEKSPMLVTKDVNNPGASVLAYLKNHAPTLKTGHIYGGTGCGFDRGPDRHGERCQDRSGVGHQPSRARQRRDHRHEHGGRARHQRHDGPYTFDEARQRDDRHPAGSSTFHVYNSAGIVAG